MNCSLRSASLVTVIITKIRTLRADKRLSFLGLFFFLSLFAWSEAKAELARLIPPEVPGTAIAQDAFEQGEPKVENRLLIDAQVARPGDVVQVGVLFTMDEGWHIYWRDPGQGGMSTEVVFDAQPGEVGALQWPTPKVYHEGGGTILTFGYDDQILLLAPLTIPADAQGELQVSALVDYLVCKIDCIPGQAALTRMLPIEDEQVAADEATKAIFADARQNLPQDPAETGVDVEVRYSHVPIRPEEEFFVQISAIGCQEEGEEDCVELAKAPERAADAFVFDQVRGARLEVARASEHPDAHSGWFVELKGRASRDDVKDDGVLSGVLRLRTGAGEQLATNVEALFPRQDSEEVRALIIDEEGGALASSIEETGPAKESGSSLLYVLFLAFIGGALLNLMPCVFPVLAIKVFSFVNLVHQERQSIYIHSAAYTAGIVGSMMVLAGAVIALQLVGTQVGWGFQFQEPRFIAIIGAILVVFALNLFGVFEVTLNPGRLQEVATAPPSVRRSAAEGVLAVVLATPCSAPFLGTAVGFALASSPVVIALIFFVLAMGLATPFVVLTLTPGAAKFLPRPGAWMTYFKQLLGFALLGTAIWLVWLVGQMLGSGAVTALLAFFLACGLGAWVFGIVQFRSGKARAAGILVALAIIATAGFFTLRFDDIQPASASQVAPDDGLIPWQSWSEEAVQAALADGNPVFIDFTADWCITCKVNKRNAIETDEVAAAMADLQVIPFIADWTRRDEKIRVKLAEFGKAGVPMYLLYDPADPKNPQVLPELLTKNLLLNEINKIAQ